MTITNSYEDAKADRASSFTRRKTALVAGAVAFAVATLGLASAAGAAGNAPRLEKPSVVEDASSSSYLAGYQATPTGGLASASVTFTVPAISCTAADKADRAQEWNGVYTDTLESYALVAGYCLSSGPAYNWQFSTLAGAFNETGAAAGDVVVASLSSRPPPPGPRSTT